jgi:uncharacterized delta-60 repeat protein
MNQKTIRTFLLIALLNTINTHFIVAASGQLDPYFGNQGITLTAVSSQNQLQSVAIQSDDKIVIAGSLISSDQELLVARYTADGILDITFNTTGIQSLLIGSKTEGFSTVLQPYDEKILVSGSAYESQRNFALARFNTDGSLDTTFNTTGYVTQSIDAGASSYAVGIQSSGAIVTVGASVDDIPQFTLVQFDSAGHPDASFGNYGIVTTPVSLISSIQDIAIQPYDDKIVAVGYTSDATSIQMAIARYNTDGSLDNSFGTLGIVTPVIGTESKAYSVAIQNDGSIVVAGYAIEAGIYNAVLLRYTSSGMLDSSFNYTGIVQTVIANGSVFFAVAIQANGDIVAAGCCKGMLSEQLLLMRYTTSGTLDNTFGTNGVTTTTVGAVAYIQDIGFQSDGDIITAGMSDNKLLLARYLA